MKIFFAVATYWPMQDGVAGITGYLAEGLASRGHEVTVLTGMSADGTGELSREEVHNSVSIKRMKIYVRWPLQIRGMDAESSREKYYGKIQEARPDILIVVCSQIWTFDWLIPYLDRLPCPKVFYSHGYSKWKEHYDYREKLRHRNILGVIEEYKCKRYYDKLYKYIAKYDKAIYLSDNSNSVKYAKLHHLNNGVVIENAIDDIFFSPEMQHEYGKKASPKISYLYVANFNENKNQKMLLRAYARADIGESRLVFAGYEENSYLREVKKLAEEIIDAESGKKVDFCVHIPRERVIALYRSLDIFVCTSSSETWSIVAHEAAATAMPIISTDVGIYSSIAGTVIVHNEDELVKAMEKLYYNADERAQRGEAARQWILQKQCRIGDKVEQLEKELISCIKSAC